ncbi:hypothetical protein PENVUL_c002G00863 [Penicillium vulpinum]|uniref:Uncharacterized protein n=1 Tax=Penicillium vulpinum TaxID=29845 RepID=A0A1V6SBJ9_9EURO|nr:hypothetical protein PENVUL_c002G00863 [Penicillium vulpinum]
MRTIVTQQAKIPLPVDVSWKFSFARSPTWDNQIKIHHFCKKDVHIQGRDTPTIIHIHDNPYPAALDNCRDALQWAHSPAGRIELRSPLSGRDGRRGFDNCRTRL